MYIEETEVMKMTIEILAGRHAVSHKYLKCGYNWTSGSTDERLHKYTHISQHGGDYITSTQLFKTARNKIDISL